MTAKNKSLKKEAQSEPKPLELKKEPPIEEAQVTEAPNVNDNSGINEEPPVDEPKTANPAKFPASEEEIVEMGYMKKDLYDEALEIHKEIIAGKDSEISGLKARIRELEGAPEGKAVNLEELAESFSLEDIDKGLGYIKAKIKGF